MLSSVVFGRKVLILNFTVKTSDCRNHSYSVAFSSDLLFHDKVIRDMVTLLSSSITNFKIL